MNVIATKYQRYKEGFNVSYHFLLSVVIFVVTVVSVKAQELTVHAGPQYLVIDYNGPMKPGETYVLERYSATFDRWDMIGSFQRPSDQKVFTERYFSMLPAYPELAWVPMDSSRLSILWEQKIDIRFIAELEPYRDRIISSAMGFSVLLPRMVFLETHRLRVRDIRGEVMGEIPFEMPTEVIWPRIHFQDMNIYDGYTGASWWAPYTGTIHGFKVYRSIEYQDRFEPYDAFRSLSMHHDTMIFIMRDTLKTDPGIYQYYITLLDVAGNESPPSVIVRMPNMGDLPLPYIQQLYTVNREDIRAVEIFWKISQPDRIRTLQLFREDPATSDKIHIANVSPSDTSYIDFVENVQQSYFYHLEVIDVVWPDPIRTAPVFGSSTKRDTAFASIRLSAVPIENGIAMDIHVDHAMYLDGFFITRGANFDPELEIISTLIKYNPAETTYSYIDTSASLKGDVPYGYSLLLASDSYTLSPYRDTIFEYPGVAIRVPEPILIKSELQTDGVARIIWDAETFEAIPIRHFRVCRADEKGQPIKNDCREVSNLLNSIEISDVNPGAVFVVQAVHMKGDIGFPATTGSLLYPDQRIEGPEYLWIKRAGISPVIGWAPVNDQRIRSLMVYRSFADEGKQPERIATLSPDDSEFEDKTLDTGRGSVIYQIVPELYNGTPGIPSQTLYIRYE